MSSTAASFKTSNLPATGFNPSSAAATISKPIAVASAAAAVESRATAAPTSAASIAASVALVASATVAAASSAAAVASSGGRGETNKTVRKFEKRKILQSRLFLTNNY